jgi:hypothetical protein
VDLNQQAHPKLHNPPRASVSKVARDASPDIILSSQEMTLGISSKVRRQFRVPMLLVVEDMRLAQYSGVRAQIFPGRIILNPGLPKRRVQELIAPAACSFSPTIHGGWGFIDGSWIAETVMIKTHNDGYVRAGQDAIVAHEIGKLYNRFIFHHLSLFLSCFSDVDYLSIEMSVIVTDIAANIWVLGDSRLASFCRQMYPSEIAEAIVQCLGNYSSVKEFSEKQIVMAFSRDFVADEVLEVFRHELSVASSTGGSS